MLITLLLLAIFTIGAASATDNADALAVDDTGDNQVVETPADADFMESQEDSDILGSPTMYFTSDNITSRYTSIAGVYDYSNGLEGDVYLFADDNQVYYSQVSGKNSLFITGNEIIGSFNGTYNMKLVYNASNGNNYFKEGTVNFEVPIINKVFNPEDFKVTFPNSEIDVDDENAMIVSYYCPEGIKEGSSTIFVYYGDGEYDRTSFSLDSSDVGTYQDITWGSLYQWNTGKYNLRVCYSEDWENFMELGSNNLTVTKTYTADDFIGIITDVNEYERDVANVWDDDGLNGTVTVYANGAQVYSKKLVAGPSEGVLIYVENLTGNFNGQYTIKAVYKKSDGKEYSKEAIVTFTGVGSPDKTTITASAMTVVYGDNKYVVATLKDSNGNAISGVNVKIKVMGVEYPVATDKNGQVKQSVSSLAVGKQAVTFTFDGNANYAKSTKSVTVTVNKATPKLTAAKKTFKKSVKTKQYTVTLKTNQNKVMKSVYVTLNVNKKTYKVKTNTKGQAIFKITNLNKKGTFTATVKFAGNSYYNAKTAKPKITVK